jgi:hypothetical protein
MVAVATSLGLAGNPNHPSAGQTNSPPVRTIAQVRAGLNLKKIGGYEGKYRGALHRAID